MVLIIEILTYHSSVLLDRLTLHRSGTSGGTVVAAGVAVTRESLFSYVHYTDEYNVIIVTGTVPHGNSTTNAVVEELASHKKGK